MRVLIIGAGIGGMTLAHGLHKAGIEVEVFEKRDGRGHELAGYGIHINAYGLRALEHCLPEANWNRFLNDSALASDLVTFYDQNFTKLLDRHGAPADPADTVAHRRGVNRLALQNVLMDGLADAGVVHFGKTFTRYEIRSGMVEAMFEDGTTATGDVLVAADGPNSRIRAQYLPDVKRQDLGVLNVAGRYLLIDGQELPPTLVDGSVNNIVPNGPGWMFAAAWRTPERDRTPDGAYGDYVTWAYADAAHNYPAGVEQLSQEALRDYVLGRISTWSPIPQRMVRDCLVDTVTLMPLKTMPHLEPWRTTQVTLLGDAIHNMTPMAGIGANTALRDAQHLCDALAGAVEHDVALLTAIATYEEQMRAYANPSVAMSARNARSAGNDAKLPRVAFRTALRVAEAVPPMKRAMFKNATELTSPGGSQ